LIIGQSKPPTTELFLKDSILLPQILDDRILLAADLAGQRGNEDLPGLEDGGDSLIVARKRSIQQLSARPANRLESL